MMKWSEAIQQCRDGRASDDGLVGLVGEAQNWFRCAVGERLDLKKYECITYQPRLGGAIATVSPKVHQIGSRFPRHILRQEWDEALATYEKIGKLLSPETVAAIQKEFHDACRRCNEQYVEGAEGCDWFDR